MPYILRKTEMREEVAVEYIGKNKDNKFEFVISTASKYFGTALVDDNGIVESSWNDEALGYDTNPLICELREMAKKIQSGEE